MPNVNRFVKNLLGLPGEPECVPGLFAAGTSVPINRGDLLELTGAGNTEWVPMDSDYNMSKNVAIAACEIKSGDPAGYYPIFLPRPGDVFEFELDAADDLALGTALYWNAKNKVTDTAGTNILGHVAGHTHYASIYPQNHVADDAGPIKGTTIESQAKVHMTIEASNSYFQALQNT